MVKIDGRKIQEVKDYFASMADYEIEKAKADNTELSEDDIATIKNKYTFKCTQALYDILSANPKKLFEKGFALDPKGWRDGYTKTTLEKRTAQRRKKNKAARAARKDRKNK